MSYLVTQIFLYMLATFILGLILGWLIWGLWKMGRSATEGEDGATSEQMAALRKERDTLKSQLEAERQAAAKLNQQISDQKAALEACEAKCASLEAENASAASVAPVVAAVAATDVEPAEAVETPEAAKPTGIDGPREGVADDLKRISGVGPKLEKLLHTLGFYHFDQIAAWTDSEIAWVDQNLEGFYGRVTRDKWVEQAKELAKGD